MKESFGSENITFVGKELKLRIKIGILAYFKIKMFKILERIFKSILI